MQGPGRTIRYFKYCAAHLNRTPLKIISQLGNIDTFKRRLKKYNIFGENFDLEAETFRDFFATYINLSEYSVIIYGSYIYEFCFSFQIYGF